MAKSRNDTHEDSADTRTGTAVTASTPMSLDQAMAILRRQVGIGYGPANQAYASVAEALAVQAAEIDQLNVKIERFRAASGGMRACFADKGQGR